MPSCEDHRFQVDMCFFSPPQFRPPLVENKGTVTRYRNKYLHIFLIPPIPPGYGGSIPSARSSEWTARKESPSFPPEFEFGTSSVRRGRRMRRLSWKRRLTSFVTRPGQ